MTNQVGEKIDPKLNSCREMNLVELMNILQFNISTYWSWGCKNLTVDNTKRCKFLRINVNGHHHKGHVYIFLNGGDMFDVFLTTTKGTIKDRTEEMGIFNDMLVTWIDNKIERIPEYVD